MRRGPYWTMRVLSIQRRHMRDIAQTDPLYVSGKLSQVELILTNRSPDATPSRPGGTGEIGAPDARMDSQEGVDARGLCNLGSPGAASHEQCCERSRRSSRALRLPPATVGRRPACANDSTWSSSCSSSTAPWLLANSPNATATGIRRLTVLCEYLCAESHVAVSLYEIGDRSSRTAWMRSAVLGAGRSTARAWIISTVKRGDPHASAFGYVPRSPTYSVEIKPMADASHVTRVGT